MVTESSGGSLLGAALACKFGGPASIDGRTALDIAKQLEEHEICLEGFIYCTDQKFKLAKRLFVDSRKLIEAIHPTSKLR